MEDTEADFSSAFITETSPFSTLVTVRATDPNTSGYPVSLYMGLIEKAKIKWKIQIFKVWTESRFVDAVSWRTTNYQYYKKVCIKIFSNGSM